MKNISPARARMPGQPLIALVAIPMAWAMLRVATGDFGLPAALPTSATLAKAAVPVAGKPPNPVLFSNDAEVDARAFWRPVTVRDAMQLPAFRSNRAQRDISLASAAIKLPGRVNFANAGEVAPELRIPGMEDKPSRAPVTSIKRWEADTWLFLRDAPGRSQPLGALLPVYGGSQVGAVLRFKLMQDSKHRPVAYLRAVHALEARESDIALGLAIRPLTRVPVTAYAETRVSRRGAEVDVRPAAFLTAGIDDAPLPFGARARGYAQAGYVGGRGATAFADGSLIAEREVLRRGDNNFGIGGGVWGGAQRDTARLDVGPSASLRFKLGDSHGRLAFDYRFRVAGNAAPADGAALTLSAGF